MVKDNEERYASLESLLKLKNELFQETGVYDVVEEEEDGGLGFNEYKDELLRRAGLDIDIVRALTEEKNRNFVGENYTHIENFRKNVENKVDDRSKVDSLFSETFEKMVKSGAIKRKHKDNLVYRLNPRIKDIKNNYLREYMRLVLHANQIIAQEGEITALIDLDEE